MILRIDNVFFNAPEVMPLASFYSSALGLPVRRAQEEGPGLMWAEISVGGMELSFRKAAATAEIHRHLKRDFLETPPGQGATISFEVADTDKTRNKLESMGVKFHGDPIVCNGGQEIISIFSDPSGRAVQLYEPRFSDESTMFAASRGKPSPFGGVPHALSNKPVLKGSNLRSSSDLAYSVTFSDVDLKQSQDFYSNIFEATPLTRSNDHVTWNVDGAMIEIRSKSFHAAVASERHAQQLGVTPILEVRSAHRAMAAFGAVHTQSPLSLTEKLGAAKEARAVMRDPLGNSVEIWERPRSN